MWVIESGRKLKFAIVNSLKELSGPRIQVVSFGYIAFRYPLFLMFGSNFEHNFQDCDLKMTKSVFVS